MTGNPDVIQALQSAIASEAHLNAQYRRDWRWMKRQGFAGVRKTAKRFGSDAHAWLKQVTDRVEFFGASSAYQMGPVTAPATFTAVLENELALELAIVQPYEQAVQICMRALDDTSRNLFEHLLKWHQKHVAWLEQQLGLIQGFEEDTGEARYLQTKV